MSRGTIAASALLTLSAAACSGKVGAIVAVPPPLVEPPPVPPVGPEVIGPGKSGLRRLTQDEYSNTIADLLGVDVRAAASALPEDVRDPFDNDSQTQRSSAVLIEGAESLAQRIADRIAQDPAARSAIVGCTPSGPGDADCMRAFISRFGRRVLRRPLGADEVERYRALQTEAIAEDDFYLGVKLVLRAFFQLPEFLYRIETGAAVPDQAGLFRLTDFEIAARLSYLLWGSTPDEALLDLAAQNRVSSPADVRAAAVRMLDDPRARDRTNRFHQLWLGYEQLPHPPDLAAAMQEETRALVTRIVFDQAAPYGAILRSKETYADPLLAAHYGLPAPPSPSWVSYGTNDRAGILSHGSVLSNGGKFSDTSPTVRGKFIRTRLLCQPIPPPPQNVDSNDPPPAEGTSRCKRDRYAVHARNGLCAGCHLQMDPIGFGLERFDAAGRYRTVESGAPECAIDGRGELTGIGTFAGPAELGELLAGSDTFFDCVATQTYRFAMGRLEGADDGAYLEHLRRNFRGDADLRSLILDLVSVEAFGFRREE